MKKDNSNSKKEDITTSKTGNKQVDKKGKENITPGKASGKKKNNNSSASIAASKSRSAVDHVKPNARGDVRGSSGLTNTGPFVSYENQD